jgi:hypothetical protein
MQDNDLLTHWRKHYDAPDADNEAVLAETDVRFLKQTWEQRKGFVDGLETAMLDDEISIKERAERLSLHRRYKQIHERLKNVGR